MRGMQGCQYMHLDPPETVPRREDSADAENALPNRRAM